MAKRVRSRSTARNIHVGDPDLFQTFLTRGYLPEVLPPIFTSKKWASKITGKRISLELGHEDLDRIPYSCTKRGYGRRYFDVVHPASAIATAAWLSIHWESVQNICNKLDTAPLKLSIPDEEDNRSISTCSFDKVLRLAKQKLSGARYVVRADIAKYYPTIYTHVISWALHGKDAAKRDRKIDSKDVFGNELDWAIRIGQGNQTKGIPIGPDFSRVVGELVGCAIDRSILDRVEKQCLGYVRNVDDFYIGARDLASAEAILHAVQEGIREYELEINDDKSSVKEASTLIDENWIHELEIILESAQFDVPKSVDRAFDRAFQLATSSSADSALKYLVRAIDRRTSATNLDFAEIEHNILRSMVNFPHCLDYCILLFLKQTAIDKVDAGKWKGTIANELNHHLDLAHDHEACWLLAAVMGAKIKIGKIDVTLDARRQLLNTLLFACLDEGLIDFDESSRLDEILPTAGIATNWLLTNEILARDWGTAATRRRLRSGWHRVVGDNMSFLNNDFVSDLEPEVSRPAIPDRYGRYEDHFDFDESNFDSDFDVAEFRRVLANDRS